MSTRPVVYRSYIKDNRLIVESDRASVDNGDLFNVLEELAMPYDNEARNLTYIKMAWDIDQFVAPILKILGRHCCERLVETRKCYFRPFNIYYLPGKIFAVRLGRNESTFFNLGQYFPDDEEPEDIIRMHSYGMFLLDKLAQMGIENPTRLTSPANVFEHSILSKLNTHTVFDLPDKYLDSAEYAYNCTGRAWISNYKIGHWGVNECFDYDLSGAYPYEASKLLDTRYAQYIHSDTIPEDVHWGFMRGRIKVTSPVSPFIYQDEDGKLLNPVGSWDTYITLDEYKALKEWEMGDFKLYDGWFLKFYRNDRPLWNAINKMYEYRKIDNELNRIAKLMSVGGCYGKFVETHYTNDEGEVDKYGKYYNPFYGAQITTRTRLRVMQFIKTHQLENDIISVAVDGVLATKEVDLANDNEGKIGSWRLNPESPALVISPGLVYYGNKKPKGLTYDMVMELIKSNPDTPYYELELPRRVTLSEAIEMGDLELVGEIRDFHQSLDLVSINVDRDYKRLPRTGKELISKIYESEPLKIKI